LPRNLSNGLYSAPPNTFGVTGSVISSTAYNGFVQDIGTEMSHSLDNRGETVMVANLNLGGFNINNVAAGVANTDVPNMSQLSSVIPVGMVMPFAAAFGTNPPNFNVAGGWLLCNGQTVSRATFSALFAVLGTIYGAGDGSTTFQLPTLNTSTIIGYDGTVPVGTAGGASTATLGTGNLPAHSHGVIDPTHNHGISDPTHTHGGSTGSHTHGINDPGHAHSGGTSSSDVFGVGTSFPALLSQVSTGSATTGITIDTVGNIGVSIANAATNISNIAAATGISIADTGSGVAFSIMQPFVYMQYYIKC
jgi:microcystin-dependent protein